MKFSCEDNKRATARKGNMKAKSNQTSISSNVVWRLMEKFSAKIVTFIVSLVLARLLDPVAYGTVALITVFTTILDVFIDSGLGNALIQKKDADNLDFTSVFYFNIAMCLLLYGVMFVAAPAIAAFYNRPELVSLVRVTSLTLVISGAKNVLHANIARNMQFKKFFYVTLLGTVISAAVGLTMAFQGYGVWALVAQPLVNYSVDTIALWFVVDWRPSLAFSFERLKGLLGYGWKLLAAKLVNVSYTKLKDLLIGKIYSAEDLAFFHKGDSFPAILVPNITASIDGVVFPAMAKVQSDKGQIKELLKKSIQISSYIVFPMMAGLMACGTPFIRFLLTEKWVGCVPYLYMFCMVYAFWPFSIANLNVIRALGRSDLMLKVEIIEKIVSIALLLCFFRKGVFWIGICYMAGELFSACACAFPCKKLIGYGLLQQLRDIVPLMAVSTLMGVCVYCVRFLGLPDFLTLLIQIPMGIVIYVVLSWATKLYGFTYFVNLVKQKFHK